MYCPVCFDSSLAIQSHGVVKVIINDKQRETGRFLFNAQKESHQEILTKLKEKLDEFFSWYDDFKNKEPIKNIGLYSSDFTCTSNNCPIPLDSNISIIGYLISEREIIDILQEFAQKYQLTIDLDHE